MKTPSVEEMDTLKYTELRKLAKAAGLKSNLKAGRLLRTLKKHFHPAVLTEQSSSDSDGNSTLPDDAQGRLDEEEKTSSCHVTHRRGRGKKEIQVDSSPERENKMKLFQGDGAENDVEETSIPASGSTLQKPQRTDDETRENTANTAEIKTRRRSKRNPSSGKNLVGKIPKSAGVSKAGSKPSTPNFKRLHESHFRKMESIDKYLERKQKRLDALSSCIQDVTTLNSNQISQKTPGSNTKKSLQNKFSLLSPAPQTGYHFSVKTPANRRSAGKRSILVDKSGANPSMLSSSKMNVRFSGATKDNEHKYSLVKTPARKSSFTFVPSTNNCEPSESLPRSSIKAAQRMEETGTPAAVVTTPFKFTAENMATPNTNKKIKFNLQASLARPLGYQPHKGDLSLGEKLQKTKVKYRASQPY
ncbi:nucleolar and spindle-associated protein 1 [Rhinoderma darwinii]|uniref:nucleolar and spindle-associated protein 1 n=1 Tax=Rhinoderma darwinii TaxID=43563 RepID=UPI003F662AA7